MKKTRENFAFMLLGTNRTGKTTIARQIAELWVKTHKGQNVIAYDMQNRFNDIRTKNLTMMDEKQVGEYLSTVYNSLVIFDDYRMLYDTDRTPKELLNFMQLRNERCNDVIFITHSPNLVLNRLTYYLTHYYLFYTQGVDKGFSDKIDNAYILIKLRNIVNRYRKMYGRGTYLPAAPAKSFPYIVFDNGNQTVQYVNFTFEQNGGD